VSAGITVRPAGVPSSLSAEIPAVLGYYRDNPYDVVITFSPGTADEATWVFGRELLAAGIEGPAGEGDVRISMPSGDAVLSIELRSTEGQARLEADVLEVTAFLDSTYRLVPAGTERLDFDADLERLLRPGGGTW
jgi:hypothetical protein